TVASKSRIWLARPSPAQADKVQILPVDWKALTRSAATTTNYQVLPGDRIFVEAKPLVALDTFLARLFSPVERVFGVTLLGSAVYRSIATPIQRNGGGVSATGF